MYQTHQNAVNADLLTTLNRVEQVVQSLGQRGITVNSVSLLNGRPVIRIQRNGFCERLIREGKAAYVETGHNAGGQFKQGYFMQGGCRVVWSESLH
ncbi:hypothetical protein EHW64_13750 [Erwinia psidii]|uniref:hypothetical protein n=1 Tax=Erwinia psidii TaxID=69224 RepID=UPI00226B7CDC|nr:hypothetical protein [Erwinia psidii]MCX8962167.1 hypothetical protein [Erwinia psidii]